MNLEDEITDRIRANQLSPTITNDDIRRRPNYPDFSYDELIKQLNLLGKLKYTMYLSILI